MKPGRARRKQNASFRAKRRRAALPAHVRAALERFADAVARWNQLREPTTDRCPFCDAAVVIRPGDGVSHYSHPEPACPPWVPALQALGGFDMRSESL